MFLNCVSIFAIAVALQLGLSCAKSYIIQVRDAESGAPVPSLSTLVLGYHKDGHEGSITLSPNTQELFVPDLNDPAMISSIMAYGEEAACQINGLDWDAGEQDPSTGVFVLRVTAKCTHHSPSTSLRGYSAATGTPNGTPVVLRRVSKATGMAKRNLSNSMELSEASSLGQ